MDRLYSFLRVNDVLRPAAEAFPVRSWRSYSGGGAGCAWARPHALLADVQKVLRHARKLPDKTQHLYKVRTAPAH